MGNRLEHALQNQRFGVLDEEGTGTVWYHKKTGTVYGVYGGLTIGGLVGAFDINEDNVATIKLVRDDNGVRPELADQKQRKTKVLERVLSQIRNYRETRFGEVA